MTHRWVPFIQFASIKKFLWIHVQWPVSFFSMVVTIICLSMLLFCLFTTSGREARDQQHAQPAYAYCVIWLFIYGFCILYRENHLFNLTYTKINSIKLITSVWFRYCFQYRDRKKSNLKKNYNSIIKPNCLYHNLCCCNILQLTISKPILQRNFEWTKCKITSSYWRFSIFEIMGQSLFTYNFFLLIAYSVLLFFYLSI